MVSLFRIILFTFVTMKGDAVESFVASIGCAKVSPISDFGNADALGFQPVVRVGNGPNVFMLFLVFLFMILIMAFLLVVIGLVLAMNNGT